MTPFVDESVGACSEGTADFAHSIWKGIMIGSGNFTLRRKEALERVQENDRTLIGYGRF